MNMTPIEAESLPDTLCHSAFTIQGSRRHQNGDRYLVNGRLAMVADGISSSSRGADAAGACIERMSDVWKSASSIDQAGVRAILQNINGHLLSRAMMLPSNERRRGGCCVAGVVVDRETGTATVFHSGDASVHIIGNRGFSKLTVDHSGDDGSDRRRSRVRSALGVIPAPEISISEIKLNSGDHLILATDGCQLDPVAETLAGCSATSPDDIMQVIRAANDTPIDDATAVILSTQPPA